MVEGARPLFFLDYIATGKLAPETVASIVEGIASGCREKGCALLGGETAEMPGFYADGEYDVAGFIVGVVDQEKIIDGKQIAPGDVVLGLPSMIGMVLVCSPGDTSAVQLHLDKIRQPCYRIGRVITGDREVQLH